MTRTMKIALAVAALLVWLVSMGGWFILGTVVYRNDTQPSPPTIAPAKP